MSFVATPAELLSFGNRVRKAAGVGQIDHLPWDHAARGQVHKCLVALALHPECRVFPNDAHTYNWEDGDKAYVTFGSFKADFGVARALMLDMVKVLPGYVSGGGSMWAIELPEEIGNAVWAFDRGDYVQ